MAHFARLEHNPFSKHYNVKMELNVEYKVFCRLKISVFQPLIYVVTTIKHCSQGGNRMTSGKYGGLHVIFLVTYLSWSL